ncbi:MAG: hypothetical protein COU90_00200 [Candidatus Ryanbacteria bacterium CG10_big_fil_rev_8_21_14_0_10_43_42]|uniref:Uncharacterized protein n=1 Tax=Candidatus Ryanbacteria bacterium CG10_big_fil_rev_8_21_14_0_10_43_42 TaxID=1974864 RepID=A0A2M8KYB4_9BACT|nr:MAG: hypothetical protein COU90_00200 [Candidatus Ryanbacteria bacterium CG10_big_fil_rev_8_21_14_0_10_43_42]
MAKSREKLRALQLRRRGKSIKEIANLLNVSKSSASVWCRNINLTSRQASALKKNMIQAGHLGRMRGAETNRKKKQDVIDYFTESAKKEIQQLSKNEFLIAGLCLYWGEGSKKSKLSFSNSDPHMISFMFEWFQVCMDVKKEEFMPRIFINAIHGPRIKEVLTFWSDLLELPEEQFYKPILLKERPKKIYENHDSYYGVLALGVSQGSRLKYKILALIEAMKNKMPV